MAVPKQVVKLVDQFKDQSQAVRSSAYKEDWVRRDYIDPFFKALGWAVDRQKSGPLIFKEVVPETIPSEVDVENLADKVRRESN